MWIYTMQLSTSQTAYKTEKAERLEARLSRAQKELIKHAADLLGDSSLIPRKK